MLEKYLNKEVELVTQVQGTALKVSYKGIITGIDDKFIELDNKSLISYKFIYRITLK